MKQQQQQPYCVLCGRSQREVPLLMEGMDGHICSDCVSQAYQVVQTELHSEKQKQKKAPKFQLIKPIEMKNYIDQYVIGALANVAFACGGVGLTHLVKRHHDHRRAIAAAQFGLFDKLIVAFFEADRVDHAFALHAF